MGKQEIKILIADDEDDILELVKYNLEKEGYKVFCAVDGKEAIQIAKEEVPDLIILDWMINSYSSRVVVASSLFLK